MRYLEIMKIIWKCLECILRACTEPHDVDDGISCWRPIWLLDWGFSGVYPQWFEYAAAMAYADGRAPRSWLWLVPFIVGSYPAQKDFTRRIGLALEECLEVTLDYEPEESEESHTIRNQ